MTNSLVLGHRALAILLGMFIATHIGTHLSAIAGAETHLRVLRGIQVIYRHPLVEPLLIASLVLQVAIGCKLAWRRIKTPDKGFWGWAQILSGLYLAWFLAIHTFAALTTHYFVKLDTNFYWAAGTLQFDSMALFFGPYYFFAVLSIFTHIGAAIHFHGQSRFNLVAPAFVLTGVVLGSVIVASFGGALYEIELPPEYADYFKNMTTTPNTSS